MVGISESEIEEENTILVSRSSSKHKIRTIFGNNLRDCVHLFMKIRRFRIENKKYVYKRQKITVDLVKRDYSNLV